MTGSGDKVPWVMVRLGRVVSLFAMLSALSCADEGELQVSSTPESSRHFVGAIETTDAKIALISEGNSVKAYVCGGALTYASHSRWFSLEQGQSQGPWRSVKGQSQGWSIEGEISEGEGHGVLLSPEGIAQRWQVSFAPRPLGLYELDSEFGKIGAIVQGTDDVQGTLLGKGGYRAQVTPVRPMALPNNLWIEVRLGDDLRVVRLLPHD